MNFYVLNTADNNTQKLADRLVRLIVKPGSTVEDIMARGFTNYNPPNLYWSTRLTEDISFNITISKKNLKLKEVAILDENFCQPYFCTPKIYKQISEIIDKLIMMGVFVENV